MNSAAFAIADKALLGLPVITLEAGTVLYHGARSRETIASMRPNAMFTSSLYYAIDYAFFRDQTVSNELGQELNRSLFCCTLTRDVNILLIDGVNWPALCMGLSKADDNLPKFDGWLQQYLPGYIYSRYGGKVEGAKLISSSSGNKDEYIFSAANSILKVHRRID